MWSLKNWEFEEKQNNEMKTFHNWNESVEMTLDEFLNLNSFMVPLINHGVLYTWYEFGISYLRDKKRCLIIFNTVFHYILPGTYILVIIVFGVIVVLLCMGSTAPALTTVSLSKCT